MRKNGIIGGLLGMFLAVLIIFLEPFDTNQFQSDYKLLLLSGFGAVFALAYMVYSMAEGVVCAWLKSYWVLWQEAVSVILFFLFSGTVVFLYNCYVINGAVYTVSGHVWYLTHIVAPMMLIVSPLLVYLRQKLGEKVVPVAPDAIILHGLNKHEELHLKKSDVLFVKSVENYVEIVFLDSEGNKKAKTFRQTLSNVHAQISYLEKPHRSYLVNLDNVESIHGNSQKAELLLKKTEGKIPISKSFYKNIKSKLE